MRVQEHIKLSGAAALVTLPWLKQDVWIPFVASIGIDVDHYLWHAVTHRTFWTYKSLSRLRVLHVGFDNDMKALAKCPHLTNLEELYVEDSTMTDADARVLADNPVFARLKLLSLTDMNVYHPPLGADAEKVLRDRFGDRLTLEYSVLCRQK